MTIANPTAASATVVGLVVIAGSWLTGSPETVAVGAVVFLPAFCLAAADQVSRGVER